VRRLKAVLMVFALLSAGHLQAQELEPRRWSRLPVGITFLGLGLRYSTGDILFDPVLTITDATLDHTVLGASFIHTFDWFGQYARIDVTLPYASGKWDGLLGGEPASVKRTGFLDPTFRLSINLYGAPALKGKAFGQFMAEHPVNTTVGLALGLTVPVGEYFSHRLINLGNNRWALRPQLGVLHEHNRWQFEATGAVMLYGDNRDFFPGTEVREQDPLWSVQGHVMYTFRPGLWAGASAGYAWGGQSTISGVRKDDENRIVVWSLSLGVPISLRQGLKFAFIRNRTHTDTGSDLDFLTLGWTVMLGH